MEFGWRIVLGSVIGFMGAAFGSVGGVGGGGIFVPMLTLIIGFDPKSSTALSKCKLLFKFLIMLTILVFWVKSLNYFIVLFFIMPLKKILTL